MLVETHRQWQARTGHTILERYGMSETVMPTSNPCKPGDGERVVGTVGQAAAGVCSCGCGTGLAVTFKAGDAGGIWR